MQELEKKSLQDIFADLVSELGKAQKRISVLEDRLENLGSQILAGNESVDARFSRLNSRLDKAEGIHGAR